MKTGVRLKMLGLGVGMLAAWPGNAPGAGNDTPSQSVSAAAPDAAVKVAKAPLKDWSVVRIRIPQKSDLDAAYVDLKGPQGQTITLTVGESGGDGLQLDKLAWAGSPIQAIVSLSQDADRTELNVASSLISEDDALERRKRPVLLDARLLQLDRESLKQLAIPDADGNAISMGTVLDRAKTKAGASIGVLTAKQLAQLDEGLAKQPGVELERIPPRRTSATTPERFKFLHDIAPKGGAGPRGESENPSQAGVIVHVTASSVEDTAIDLEVAPQLVQYKPARRKPGAAVGDLPEPEPIFSTRSVTTSITIFPGQSLMTWGVGHGAESIFPAGTVPLLIITATLGWPEQQPH